MRRFKDAEHLFRVAAVFLAGAAVFVVVRALLVPRSFGEYGHFRGDAIAQIAARPVAFAGHQACETCHTDVVAVQHPGKHAGVHCEACHGPLAAHAANPGNVPAPKLDTLVLCVRCHGFNGSAPQGFPQIVAAEHNGANLPCETCHQQPHNPLLGLETKP